MDLIESCRKLIACDSTPTVGNFEAAKVAAELCRQAGFFVDSEIEFQGDLQQMNVIARFSESKSNDELLLQTHLDTADSGPLALWTTNSSNPFEATIMDGSIYGLGAADVKLDFICKLEALKSFAHIKTWRHQPVLVGTYGEETGMQGALRLIRKGKISPKYALVGEPSHLQIINSAKGYAHVEIEIPFSTEEKKYRDEHNLRESSSTQSKIFNGVSAHSSTPHLGDSAILKMFEYLSQLPEDVALLEIEGGTNHNTVPAHAFLELDLVSSTENHLVSRLMKICKGLKTLEKEFLKFEDLDFTPSVPTLNIGRIRTSDDGITIEGCCRIPPIITQDIWENWMNTLKKTCEESHSIFRIKDYKKSFRTSAESNFLRAAQIALMEVGLSGQPISQSSTNESSIFSRFGIESLCFGAGVRDGNIHTPKEHVKIEDLNRSIEFYKKFIERFCL